MGALRYSFQPGPGQLYPDIPSLIQQAIESGALVRYHREPFWQALYHKAQEAVKAFLGLPADWLVAFLSSATQIWQILADATAEETSLHLLQGDFGKRWYARQKALSGFAYAYEVHPEEPWDLHLKRLQDRYSSVHTLCAVHVETSVGGYLPDLASLRMAFPESLILIDACSSLGGIQLPWEKVDGVFASVQKCLGLPAGLSLLILGPRAIERFAAFSPQRYDALPLIIEKAQQAQPLHTPNLLGIYLLAHSLPQRPPIEKIEASLCQRAAYLYKAMRSKGYEPLLPEAYRAPTVLAFQAPSEQELVRLRAHLEAEGFYLGWGYGEKQASTFRLANFPALPDEAYDQLLALFP
ncbi:MAG: aminotransferase class V-fold PLP-dependent enzyme [Bacteroidia bacterium]